MKNIEKNEAAYKTIGEVAKELGLVDKKTGSLQTHTIRYWETQFKQIKPSIRAGKRRYYSSSDVKIINYVMYLLKKKGFTINGVKKILGESQREHLDENINLGLYKPNIETSNLIKSKVNKISSIIKELKKLKNG